MKNKSNKIVSILVILFMVFCLFLYYVASKETYVQSELPNTPGYMEPAPIISYSVDSIPEYSENMEKPFVYIDNNVPDFNDLITTIDINQPFEKYTNIASGDDRCGVAIANICIDTMPTEDRKSISIDPTGWQEDETYIDLDTGKIRKLYNRCHLIAYSLTGENNNEKNLITGTNYMNISGMYPFEEDVLKYIKNNSEDENGNEQDCHVLYRVTPIFSGDNLVCSGVQMEAMSVEDSGESLCFNVYVYNVQKGVKIDYSTGKKLQ